MVSAKEKDRYNKKTMEAKGKKPEFASAFVRVAHRIQSNVSSAQVLKINGKYYRVKELG